MKALRELPIQRKLTMLVLLISGATLVMAFTTVMVFNRISYRSTMVENLSVIAQIIADNSTAALSFDDRETAKEIVATHRANQNIMFSAIYDSQGRLFASYLRSELDRSIIPVKLTENSYHIFDKNSLTIFRKILLDGELIGVVGVRSDMKKLHRQETEALAVMIAIALGSSMVVLLLTLKFRSFITDPILRLANTTEEVTRKNDYSIRAKKFNDDELGHLVDGFNVMLETIQERDLELALHRSGLEEKVKGRTAELEEANRELSIAKDRAEAMNRAKSTFLANMSHELRTPLSAIIGYSEMLIEETETFNDESIQNLFVSDLSKIRRAGRQLLELIQDVLDISKIEAGKVTLQNESIDFQSFIREVIATVEPSIRQNGNDFKVQIAENIVEMKSDRVKVRQSLFNLLSNAGKFTENGTVTFSVKKLNIDDIGHIVFEVSDTGIGMSAEQIEQIFKAFTQADYSSTRIYGGAGLGLTITEHYCRILRGDIKVESEPGKGSTFTVCLPENSDLSRTQPIDQGSESEQVSSSSSSSSPSDDRKIVLVVDDDANSRELIARTISTEGYRVETAESSEKALRLARVLRPNLITLDVLMPEMNGWEVLKAVKNDPLLTYTPVIMLTIEENIDRGFALGADEYLTKPIDRNRLLVTVNKYCREAPILVVDDSEDVREIMQRTLENDGRKVLLAQNGQEGLRHLAKQIPSCVMLDLMMPEMDGFEFLSELRKVEAWHQIPIVVVTAKELTGEEQNYLNENVTTILKKGDYSCEKLLGEIRGILSENFAR